MDKYICLNKIIYLVHFAYYLVKNDVSYNSNKLTLIKKKMKDRKGKVSIVVLFGINKVIPQEKEIANFSFYYGFVKELCA